MGKRRVICRQFSIAGVSMLVTTTIRIRTTSAGSQSGSQGCFAGVVERDSMVDAIVLNEYAVYGLAAYYPYIGTSAPDLVTGFGILGPHTSSFDPKSHDT